jgi:hypothetical protein
MRAFLWPIYTLDRALFEGRYVRRISMRRTGGKLEMNDRG